MKEMGAENFAMRLFEIKPGAIVSFIVTRGSTRFSFGEGGLLASEGEERIFEEGDVVFIAPNEKHQLRNVSEKTVKFLCLIPYTRK